MKGLDMKVHWGLCYIGSLVAERERASKESGVSLLQRLAKGQLYCDM